MDEPPKTLFEMCDDTSQAEVARQLGIEKMRMSRFYRGATDVDSDIVSACKTAWGDGFDEARTLTEWYARRLAFVAAQGMATDAA